MSIKNVVFDVGNVLVRWDPQHIVSQVFPQQPDSLTLARSIFKHQIWFDLNLGLITEAQALQHYHQMLGIELNTLQQMAEIIKESLILLPESVQLLKNLHQSAFNLYALTDNTHEIMAYLRQKYDFWPLFKGVVVSAEVGCLKPSEKIYRYLLDTYQLKAEETVFIDDLAANVAGAQALGIHAVQFENIAQCIQDLQHLKIEITAVTSS